MEAIAIKLYVCPNSNTQEQRETAIQAIEDLQQQLAASISMDSSISKKLYGDERYAEFEPTDADLVVAIGGDGSVLRAAQVAYRANCPVLGIRSGRVGFLSALSVEELSTLTPSQLEALPRQERSILEFQWEGETVYALNDLVVAKSNFGETVELEVLVDGNRMNSWCGDGVLFSTPTGSTSYNLSAGGPILMPELDALLITPSCAHSLTARPLVVSDTAEVFLRVIRCGDKGALVVADGATLGNTTKGISLHVAQRKLQFISKENPLTNLNLIIKEY